MITFSGLWEMFSCEQPTHSDVWPVLKTLQSNILYSNCKLSVDIACIPIWTDSNGNYKEYKYLHSYSIDAGTLFYKL